MKAHPLVYYPSGILKEKTELVTEFNEDLREFCTGMFATMEKAGGVGLAAPQVGSNKRIFVMDQAPHLLINPEIVSKEGELLDEEGCLSLPGVYFKIKRASKIVITYQNIEGYKHTLEVDDHRAKCIQHEIDHLEGITMLDHCPSSLQKSMYIQKINKEKKKRNRR